MSALDCPSQWVEWLGSISPFDVLVAIWFSTSLALVFNVNTLLICLGVSIAKVYEKRFAISLAWMLLLIVYCGLRYSSWLSTQLMIWICYPVAFALWPWIRRWRTTFAVAIALALSPLWIWKPLVLGWHASSLLFLWMWPWLERHRNWLLFFAAVCFTPAFATYYDLLNYWYAFWPLLLTISGYLFDPAGPCLWFSLLLRLSSPAMICILLVTWVLWRKFSRFGDAGSNMQQV